MKSVLAVGVGEYLMPVGDGDGGGGVDADDVDGRRRRCNLGGTRTTGLYDEMGESTPTSLQPTEVEKLAGNVPKRLGGLVESSWRWGSYRIWLLPL